MSEQDPHTDWGLDKKAAQELRDSVWDFLIEHERATTADQGDDE